MSPLKEAGIVGIVAAFGLGLVAVGAEALNYLEKHSSKTTAIVILCIGAGILAGLAVYTIRKIEK